MEALKADVQTKAIDFKKIAENVSAEVKRDDFEKEREELIKKKGILLKTIEVNKRYEKDIQKLKMEELQIERKQKAYNKKIEYKINELKEQKNEIKDLKQK